MSEQIAWCVELVVRPGKLGGFQQLTAEMVATTAEEAGVLAYQRFIDETGKIIHLYERYENSDAALGHLQVFHDKFADRFAGMVSRARFTVYGTPSAELNKVLDGFGAIYLTTFGDLNYWP